MNSRCRGWRSCWRSGGHVPRRCTIDDLPAATLLLLLRVDLDGLARPPCSRSTTPRPRRRCATCGIGPGYGRSRRSIRRHLTGFTTCRRSTCATVRGIVPRTADAGSDPPFDQQQGLSRDINFQAARPARGLHQPVLDAGRIASLRAAHRQNAALYGGCLATTTATTSPAAHHRRLGDAVQPALPEQRRLFRRRHRRLRATSCGATTSSTWTRSSPAVRPNFCRSCPMGGARHFRGRLVICRLPFAG